MVVTRIWYLRLATLLPLLAPFPMGAILVGSILVGLRLPHWFGTATVLSGMGLLLFGPVYIVLTAGILFVLRHRTWWAHALAALAAPWLMIAAAGAVQAIADRSTDLWSGMRLYAMDCLTLGYAYVALALLGMLLFERAGWIRDLLRSGVCSRRRRVRS